MRLRVGFDATAAARQRAGIGRYARELLRALTVRDDGFKYRVFYCAGGEGELPPIAGSVRLRALPVSDRVTNLIWHRARLPIPIQLATGPLDLVYSPDFTAPPALGRPSIVTVHDLAFIRRPECAYPTLRSYLERVVPRAVQGASHVAVVSHNTKRDVMDILQVPEDKISVVSPGVAPGFRPPVDRAAAEAIVRGLGITGAYILAVGTLEPRKNYVRLLEAYARLRDRGWTQELVIAGRRGWLYEPIFERMHALRLDDYVRIVDTDDRALGALYGLTDVFVSASVYEGFGIPPVEALACAAPVACSDAASLPEVVGDAALLFDPSDVESMACTIERLLTDRELAEGLAARGPVQAARFSWAASADRAATMYRQVAERA